MFCCRVRRHYRLLAHATNYRWSKNTAYSNKHVRLWESSIKDKTCQYGKVIATGKFVNQYKMSYKRNGLQSWLFHWFIHWPEKNLPIQKVISMSRFALRCVIKEMGSKVGCFAGFCYHPITIMSAHTHAYRYPLFKSGIKIDM